MNGMPVSIFSALQNYLLGKAERNHNREAAAMVEKDGYEYRMYLTLAFDTTDFGRDYECETRYEGKVIHHSRFTYYGGSKR